MRLFAGFLLGLMFGVGLIISGMSDPAKVLNFLDFAGTWDPSLAFVMGGAVLVAFVGYRLVLGRERPLLAAAFSLPVGKSIDMPLIAGSAIFGIGWGMSGLCPGPALTSLGLASQGVLAFVPAMMLGIAVARHVEGGRSVRPGVTKAG